jgi:hypothetical protein
VQVLDTHRFVDGVTVAAVVGQQESYTLGLFHNFSCPFCLVSGFQEDAGDRIGPIHPIHPIPDTWLFQQIIDAENIMAPVP